MAAARRLTRAEILGPSRDTNVVKARAAIARRLHALEIPINEIARQLGRNHATVQYYLGRVHRDRPVTPRTAWRVQLHI